jgi:hypothetical protein
MGINRNFKLDNIESCFGYVTGCFVASLLAMTTYDWRRIQTCHCERSEAIPLHNVKLVI